MRNTVLLIAALIAAPLFAQEKLAVIADLNFDSILLNEEFGPSHDRLQASGTLGAAKISPYLGLGFGNGNRVMFGGDLCKYFGDNGTVEAELAIWYQKNMPLGKTDFTFAAGVVPYSLSKGSYTSVIWSDDVCFTDFNFDGFMFQIEKDESLFELIFDWNGMLSETAREQFSIYSYGQLWFTPVIGIGYQGNFHHYSSSLTVHGVVDDHIFNPFLSLDFSSLTGLDEFYMNLGGIAGYQRDRVAGIRKIPLGADVLLEVQKWGVGIVNDAYYGDSQAPFYASEGPDGEVYGSDLYARSAMWRISEDGRPGFYDRLEVYWAPKIGDILEIRLRLLAHFASSLPNPFAGTQQIGEVRVNLENLLKKR